MPPPTIYKESLEVGAATPPGICSRDVHSVPTIQKTLLELYPTIFCVCVSSIFLPSSCSCIAVFPFCLFYHFLSKYFASSWRLSQLVVCLLEDHIPPICGIALLPWQRLFIMGSPSPHWLGNSNLLSLLLHMLRYSETAAQIWLSRVINDIPGV